MTLINQNSSVTHTGNGVTTLWPYTFIIPDDDAVRVGLFTIATSVLITLDPSEYSITGVGNDAGGEVTYPLVGSPIASTHRLVIWREVPYTQDTELTNQTPYYPKVLEEQLDLIVMQVQQLAAESDRSIKVTLGSTLEPDVFVAELQAGAAAAAASAGAAAASASAASASAGAAATSETNAAASKTAAGVSETNAAASKTAAAASAAAALTSENNAETAETNAAASAVAAAASAVTANNVVTSSVVGAVRVDTVQSHTAAQKGQARANIGADLLSGFRNKIIGGGFDGNLWQRGTSFTGVGYTADRFITTYLIGGAVTVDTTRQAFTPGQTDVPGEPEFFFRANFSAVSGGAVPAVMTRIEGVRTHAGKRVTHTTYMKVASGAPTANAFIRQNFGAGGSPEVSAFKPVTLSTSWQRVDQLFDMGSISGKTLGANNYVEVGVQCAANTPIQIDIARVSFVEGDATAEADPFSPRHIQQELALCQRYYQTVTLYMNIFGQAGFAVTQTITFPDMRVIPTIGVLVNGTNSNVTSSIQDSATTRTFRAGALATADGTVLWAGRQFSLDAEL